MTNEVVVFDPTAQMIMSNKTGKTGSFARAVAFASRDVRMAFGQNLYAQWLATGQYRPLVMDILSCGLVAKAAVPYLQTALPATGPVTKAALMTLCQQVTAAVRASGKQVKGDKAYVYGIVERIADQGATVEA